MTGVDRCGGRLWVGMASLCIIAGTAPAAWAVLLAYEGFDYTVGSNLGGSGAATGQWTDAWDEVLTNGVAGVTTIQSGSLTYNDGAGNALTTTGNSILNTGVNGTNSQQGRNLVAGRGADGTSTWISFLAQRMGEKSGTAGPGGTPTYVRGANFSFIDTITVASQERFNIIESSNVANDAWMVRSVPAPATNVISDPEVPIDQMSLFVMRIDHKPGNDDEYFWINPLLNATPSDASASGSHLGIADYTFNRVRTFAGNPSGGNPHAELLFDELRIGTSYADVTPFGPGVIILPGDTDEDGVPGEFPDDFEPIRANFRKNVAQRTSGDLVDDDVINFEDFREWKTAFLSGGGSLADIDLSFTASVPEPSSGLLLILACSTWYMSIRASSGRRTTAAT